VSRHDDERVADILDAASEIAAITELGRDAWDKDRIRRLAVERLLEIIGEAANSLSEDFCTQHPSVPWRDIIWACSALADRFLELIMPLVGRRCGGLTRIRRD
jgi:uncharacterized protein with HEPN domain